MMRKMLHLALRPLAAVAVVASLSLYSTAVPAVAQSNEYRLDTGDHLRITVFGHEDLSGEFEVSSTGGITMPLVGEVPAVNQTSRDLERAIIAKLKPDYLKNPQVSVEVLTYRPFYIIGEVKNPGSYAYVGGMRVVNAIAMAGGFTYRARESRLLITRGSDGKQVEASQHTLVRPGDVIEVPERFF
jgi:polysaccharide export outer membrane protein